jgi:hypothetical protein
MDTIVKIIDAYTSYNYSYPNAMLHNQNISPENLHVSPTHFPAFSPYTITLTRYFYFWFGPARSISPSYVKHIEKHWSWHLLAYNVNPNI